MQFVLASQSPRRSELLRRAGYTFETTGSGFPEVTLRDPKETALENARGKALTIAGEGDLVLAADTVVYLPNLSGSGPDDGEILGKAESKQDVRRMLRSLRGESHEVYSGVAAVRGGELIEDYAVTKVKMRRIPDAEVEAYVETEEGIGKAGGYAIQGRAAVFIEWIEGEYTNVVGLPLSLTSSLLDNFGVRWY